MRFNGRRWRRTTRIVPIRIVKGGSQLHRPCPLCLDHAGLQPGLHVACVLVLAWGLTGPLFGFSDTWQLVINTGTTIVTFLMVFLIQNTQNRDARACTSSSTS